MFDVSQSTFRGWVVTGLVRPPYSLSERVQLFDVEQLREDWGRLKSGQGPEQTPNPWDKLLEK